MRRREFIAALATAVAMPIAGRAQQSGKVFRIGHIGHFNDLMLMGTLSGVEMGLDLAKVPHRGGGVLAAMEVLKGREVALIPKIAVA